MPDMKLDFHCDTRSEQPAWSQRWQRDWRDWPGRGDRQCGRHLGERDVRLPLTSKSVWRLIRNQTANVS
jgi:hypothetical protein